MFQQKSVIMNSMNQSHENLEIPDFYPYPMFDPNLPFPDIPIDPTYMPYGFFTPTDNIFQEAYSQPQNSFQKTPLPPQIPVTTPEASPEQQQQQQQYSFAQTRTFTNTVTYTPVRHTYTEQERLRDQLQTVEQFKHVVPRGFHSVEATRILMAHYEQSHFISRENRIKLAQEIGLSDKQVKTWFQNQRMKEKRRLWRKKNRKAKKLQKELAEKEAKELLRLEN